MKDPKIKLCLDRDIKELIPGFLANRNKDLQTINEALAKKDFETIGTLGHWMKGSGAGYGFEEISAIGKRLEQAAAVSDLIQIQNAAKELDHYLKNIEITYG